MLQFKNPQHSVFFRKHGYLVLDLFNEEDILQLSNCYNNYKALHTEIDQTLYSSCDHNNLALTLQVENAIHELVANKLPTIFNNYEYLFATFLIKIAAKNNATVYHQDPTLVASNEFESANLWIPLQDTHQNNGNLKVIPGSHRIVDSLVVTPNFPTFFKHFDTKLDKFALEIPTKKGQAILFNNKLVHGASPNSSESERVAAVVALKSKASTWNYYYFDKQVVEKYEINKDMYARIEKNQRPKDFIRKETFQFQFPQISYITFLRFMAINYPKSFVKGVFHP